ncbi:MAG: DNA-binding protein [Novosphingobium sp.]|nr:hypothetical protein [Novosphingobium sp.]MCP5401717.1 DNA-binding protein [Novosphingobium sp.]
MKQRLKTREAAKVLEVSYDTVKKWRAQGKGPPYLKSAKTDHPIYKLEDLIAFKTTMKLHGNMKKLKAGAV